MAALSGPMLSATVMSLASALAVLFLAPTLDGVMRSARAAYTGALLAAFVAVAESSSAGLPVFLLCAPPLLGVAAAAAVPCAPLCAVALNAAALSICALALPGSPARLGLLLGAAVAFAVARGMGRNQWRALRVWTHSASLAATLWVVVPWLVAHVAAQSAAARLPGHALLAARVVPLTAPVICVATALLVIGTAVACWAGAALIAAGGTPDPMDPPHAWCSTGPYAHLRHPMQLGQFLSVGGAALLWGTGAAVLASCAVVATLLAVRGADERAARLRCAPLPKGTA